MKSTRPLHQRGGTTWPLRVSVHPWGTRAMNTLSSQGTYSFELRVCGSIFFLSPGCFGKKTSLGLCSCDEGHTIWSQEESFRVRMIANLVARKRVSDSATPDPPALRGTQCLLHAFLWSSSPSPMGLFDISISHLDCKQLFIPDSQGPGEH